MSNILYAAILTTTIVVESGNGLGAATDTEVVMNLRRGQCDDIVASYRRQNYIGSGDIKTRKFMSPKLTLKREGHCVPISSE